MIDSSKQKAFPERERAVEKEIEQQAGGGRMAPLPQRGWLRTPQSPRSDRPRRDQFGRRTETHNNTNNTNTTKELLR